MQSREDKMDLSQEMQSNQDECVTDSECRSMCVCVFKIGWENALAAAVET